MWPLTPASGIRVGLAVALGTPGDGVLAVGHRG